MNLTKLLASSKPNSRPIVCTCMEVWASNRLASKTKRWWIAVLAGMPQAAKQTRLKVLSFMPRAKAQCVVFWAYRAYQAYRAKEPTCALCAPAVLTPHCLPPSCFHTAWCANWGTQRLHRWPRCVGLYRRHWRTRYRVAPTSGQVLGITRRAGECGVQGKGHKRPCCFNSHRQWFH